MEAKLFMIGVELMVLSYIVKVIFDKDLWRKKRFLFQGIHVIFWIHVAVMAVGFFLTMKLNKEFKDVMGLNIAISTVVVVCALLWAVVRVKRIGKKESSPEKRTEKENAWILRVLREEKEWIDTGFSAIFMASFIMFFIVQAFKIPSGSMRSTLVEGDHLFVNKFIYGVRVPFSYKKLLRLRDVRFRDVIIFKFPSNEFNDRSREQRGKDFIKRAIGLPGDTIEIKDKVVFRNGKALDEPYIQNVDPRIFSRRPLFVTQEEYQRSWEAGKFALVSDGRVRDNFGPITVPEGYFFALGDNRDQSFDSRFWGPLPFSHLKGQAWLLYWPPKRIKIIK